jgi:hypothetical protein
MYSIEVVASDFDGKMKIKQHQLITRLIADDVKQWHGAGQRQGRGWGCRWGSGRRRHVRSSWHRFAAGVC